MYVHIYKHTRPKVGLRLDPHLCNKGSGMHVQFVRQGEARGLERVFPEEFEG